MKKILVFLLIILGTNFSYGNNTINTNKRTPIKPQSFSRKKIYETKYFRLYYNENSIDATKKLISVADNIAEAEIKFFKMEMPKKKIKVYIEDGRDDTNAYSTGHGIHLYINNIGIVTSEFRDWIPFLFSHELTHELLSYKIKETGFNKYIPLSDEIVNRAAVPRWWTEGMAVLMESMITQGGGRTFDPQFTAIAIRDLNEDDFRGLGPNPSYNRAYEYGNSFVKFYLDTFGAEKSSEAIDYYAHHKNSNIGAAYAHVVNLTGDELYEKWQTYLKGNIDESKILEGGIVMDNDYSLLQIIRDKEDIYLYSIKKDEIKSKLLGIDIKKTSLMKITLDNYGNIRTKKEFKDVKINTFGQIAILDGVAYYSTLRKSSIRGTLDLISYKIDLEDNEKTFLKDVKRATNFINVNGTIYYSFNDKGTQGISSLDNKTILGSGKYEIKNITPTHDGKILVTAHLTGNMGLKIYELDPKTKDVQYIVDGSSPYKVGDSIYYINNYNDNINNIYKIKIGDNTATKLTNVRYDATSPIDINGKLFYGNFSKNGYRLTRLGKTEQLKDSFSIEKLNKEKEKRYNNNLKLYGEYGKYYNPNNNQPIITSNELINNNNKEISGLYFPSFTKPQIMWDTGTLSFISRSSNDRDILLFSFGNDNIYQGGTPRPVFTFDKNSDNEAIYMTYNSLYIHYFSEPELSKSFVAWRHSEKNSNNDTAKSIKNHISEDELLFQAPFRSDYLDVGFNFTTDLQGDLFGGNPKYQKLDSSFGIGDYNTGLFHKSLLTLGAVQKNSDQFKGNFSCDTYYVDTNLKLFFPFLVDLSFFDINAKITYAPKEFSDDSRILPNLLYEPKMDNVYNNVAIRNTYVASNIYGDFKYLYSIEHGSHFGKTYITGVLFKLGYTVVNYKDNNFNDKNYLAYVTGVGLDPSVTLIGNVFNDAGEFQLGAGHAFIKNYGDGHSNRDDQTYLIIKIMF